MRSESEGFCISTLIVFPSGIFKQRVSNLQLIVHFLIAMTIAILYLEIITY